jgi:Camelysin metallo-endopeptidase
VSKARRVLITMLVLGVAGTVAGWGTFSAFSSTTSNTGNSFAAGTVYLSDNDAGSAMYSVSNQKPGDTLTKCIKVTYTGSLDSTVKLYASSVDTLGSYVSLTLTPGTGTPTFPGCTGFTAASGGAIYTGTLKGFADTYSSYSNGLALNVGSSSTWVTNDAVVYQFTLTMQDNNSANGGSSPLTTGSHSFTWEARNL